jgi:hypothetical protein
VTSTGFDPRRTRGPLGDLARFGGRPALLHGESVLSYTDLAGLVAARAEQLGGVRRLVMLECVNDIGTVVTYLAALSCGHPVLLTGRHADLTRLESRYRPDVVASGDALAERTAGTGHDLHPDLALLLSTSGSTGSPKLVRLSAENVRANAESIAGYLGLSPEERAATTLPMHYCYGLSVVNSHLLAGGSLLLTERSVVDPRLWDDFRSVRATSFAGVPHTFDLLDSSGFAERDLPTLRYVTQAGGRLEPERVRRYARLGRTHGFELVVMYGQTEATARMAWLPPHLAEERPEAIGVPVPGGDFRVDPLDPLDPLGRTPGGVADAAPVGELVYTGPNVMLGYASGPRDLALGRVVHELRTGDLARQHEDGIYEVVGRLGRFAKVFGLRVDLDDLEQGLTGHAHTPVSAVEDDGRVALFVTRHLDVATVRAEVVRRGVPVQAVHIHVIESQPRTPSGKLDYAALARHAGLLGQSADGVQGAGAGPGGVSARAVRDLYAELLGRPDATRADSFVSLRGDSLSFVEVSIRLGDLLGDLPSGWPQLSADQLVARRRRTGPADPSDDAGTGAAPVRGRPPVPRPGRWFGWRRMETPLLLRAAAIVLVVASHANLISVVGGAHVLLALAGVSLARFQLSDQPPRERRRSLLRAAREIAIPSGLWIAGTGLLTGMYGVSTATLTNNLLGSDTWDVRWQFWFLEVIVWSLVGAAALVSLPAFDRLERRRPFWCAACLVAGTVLLRYVLVGVGAGPTERYALPVVLWCVALGWMAARCETAAHRVLTVAAATAATYGFFGDVVRETLVVGGIAIAACLPSVPVPRALARPVGVLAASSLFVYLTHWQVYPHLEDDHPLLATVSSFVVGVAVWKAYTTCRTLVRRHSVTSRRRLRSVASAASAGCR